MSRPARWLIAIGISVALVLFVATVVIYRISAGITESVEHKTAKTTSATVLSVAEIEPATSPRVADRDMLFKICFTIDNFDQVSAGMRQGYQSAEVQRLARKGPRCKIALARHLHRGDKLNVIYLLENQYQIDIVATTAYGEDL